VNLTAEAAQFEPARRRLVAAPGRPLRALMWGHNLNHEGAPNSQFELTIGLWRSGMIDPIMVAATDGPLRGFYEREGVNPLIASPDMLKTEDAVALTASVAALADWFQKLGADIVYANTLVSFPAILAAQRAGLPALWNCRESEPWQRYFDALDPAVRRSAYGAFGYPYRVIFVARATCDAWAPLGGRRNFTVIPNGLKNTGINRRRRIWERETARRVLGLGPRDVAAVLIGTVCERKGQIDAIEAMAALPEAARRRLRLFVVGDRDLDYSDMVHRRVAALSEAVRARLHLVPETRHVGLYQQAADIALCTSRIESYPRVILEAMAHGLPLITTLAFGIAEQVVAGQNALTYRAGDAAGLAEHMAALTIDDDRRHRMALLTNHALDSLISYDEMVRAYAALFREAYATAH
ncbi:MAG: glycosyltransferase family 4 protein, partial [Alphaproteobacteria bacterium]|nr:glycosyltransferase family 4 protein [Alphaproteobacteria bacterium]